MLSDALALSEDEREMLAIEIGLSLETADAERPTEEQFIAQLRRISAYAEEHPESLMDWNEAQREIFGALLPE